MKLIGVYLSPYVRRVAAALISRGLPYEHQPVNGYKEYEAASRYNPVGKVPSLVLDDGEILIDSSAIIDYLNELVPSAPLIPAGSRARRARAAPVASPTPVIRAIRSFMSSSIKASAGSARKAASRDAGRRTRPIAGWKGGFRDRD